MLYSHKRSAFTKFAELRGFVTVPASLRTLLTLLRHLFDLGLEHSTLKVHISAIVSYQPVGSESSHLFSHPTVKKVLRGLQNIRPPVRPPTPQCSLQIVLRVLTLSLFEPMATSSLKLLSLKTLFLVAITSAQRASELAALRADESYIQFYPEKVVLCPDISFLPEVISEFHVNQSLILPTLFPNPSSDVERMLHSLDVRRALAFYVSKTKGLP